jgi:hypothetical protein
MSAQLLAYAVCGVSGFIVGVAACAAFVFWW